MLKLKPLTFAALEQALVESINCISTDDCKHYFEHGDIILTTEEIFSQCKDIGKNYLSKFGMPSSRLE